MDRSTPLTINLASLLDISQPEMTFYETSFFHPMTDTSPVPELPSPALVRKESQAQGHHKVVKFKHLNLVVKFGGPSWVRLEEAQVMRVISQLFPAQELSVPELFGWKVDEGQNFIYMSLIDGPTLGKAWPLLSQEEKKSICGQLSQIVASLRRIQQHSSYPFIGSINSGQVQDIYFRCGHEAGPFLNVSDFNNWVQLAALPMIPISKRPPDPYRHLLPDKCSIHFSHGDLNLENIIISNTQGSRRIIGILDWEQAGWYPEYWEYCKLIMGARYSHEWRKSGWAELIMAPYKEECIALSEYWMWRCP
ncbi:kinase-like protein [Nemania abortiva]|nr:kinase-like protein [Nemania abortiva]